MTASHTNGLTESVIDSHGYARLVGLAAGEAKIHVPGRRHPARVTIPAKGDHSLARLESGGYGCTAEEKSYLAWWRTPAAEKVAAYHAGDPTALRWMPSIGVSR